MSNRIHAGGCAGAGGGVPQPRESLQSPWPSFFFLIVRQRRTHLFPSLSTELVPSSLSPPSSSPWFPESSSLLGAACLLPTLIIGVSDLLGVFFPLACAGILGFVVAGAEVLAPAFAACLSVTCTSRRDLVVVKSSVSFCICSKADSNQEDNVRTSFVNAVFSPVACCNASFAC